MICSFLGIYTQKIKTLVRKDIYLPKFIAALFTIAKIEENIHQQMNG